MWKTEKLYNQSPESIVEEITSKIVPFKLFGLRSNKTCSVYFYTNGYWEWLATNNFTGADCRYLLPFYYKKIKMLKNSKCSSGCKWLIVFEALIFRFSFKKYSHFLLCFQNVAKKIMITLFQYWARYACFTCF